MAQLVADLLDRDIPDHAIALVVRVGMNGGTGVLGLDDVKVQLQ